MIYGNTAKKPNDVGPLLLFMLALGAVAHIANRLFVPSAHPVVLPIAFLLNGIGYVMILRIDLAKGYDYAPLQAAWTAGGVAAYVLTLAVIRRSRDLDRYRYLLLVGGVVLLLLPLVPHFGENLNGARLWVHVGKDVYKRQVLEIAALAAYTQLTHSVLPVGGPHRFRLFRINMSTLSCLLYTSRCV